MAHKNRSLLASLVLRISIVSIVSIVALSAIVYTQIDRTLESLRGQTVEEQAKNLASYLEPNRGKNKVLLDLPNSFRRFYARAGDAYQYIVQDESGRRLFTSPTAFTDYFPDVFNAPENSAAEEGDQTEREDGKFEFSGPSGRKFIGMTMPVDVEGTKFFVQVAQTAVAADTFSDEITSAFLSRLLWVGIPFYCGLILVILWTLRRSLKPLHRAAQEVEKMNITDLSMRIPEGGIPSEVLPLAHALNTTFGRLEQSIREQKELTEDIAHELRTPLILLKTHMDALKHTDQTKKLAQDVDAMIKQVNQMLDVTRLDYADTVEKQPVDLAEVLGQACQDFFPLFMRAQHNLTVTGIDAPVYVSGNKDLIYRAICNLLEYALEHSDPQTPVEASLKNFTVRITDYGKKIPDDKRRVIFERFHRDSSSAGGETSTGIGLSIVTKTMEIHGGFADLEKTNDNRNTFRMVFK